MSLRHVVPALGAFALATAPAAAVEVGDLTIGGFVDAISSYADSDASDDATIEFSGTTELQFGYAIGTAVAAQVDVEFDGSSNRVDLEQAYVSWALTEEFSVSMGKMSNYIGWEVDDAPSLYRINHSLIWDLNGSDIEAVAGIYSKDAWTVGLYISDAIYETPAINGEELAIGGRVDYAAETFNVAFNIAQDSNAPVYDTLGMNLSGDFSGVENLLLFGDLMIGSDFGGKDVDVMGLMVGANYVVNEKMSVTGMLSYVSVDNGGSSDPTGIELAVALLTTPTGDSNFAVNYEISFTSEEEGFGDSTATVDNDVLWLGVEFLAVIP